MALRLLLVVVVALVAGTAGCGDRATVEPSAPQSGGLPEIHRAALPPEARHTLRLIARGGPFPYERDGAVFHNRERLLPIRRHGYYREYTVRTPGEDDRGARRIVTGRSGERYYTADHYASFREVVP